MARPPRDGQQTRKRDELTVIQSNIKAAQARRQEMYEEWQTGYQFYRTEATTEFNESRIQVNLVWAYIETMLPSLVFQNPEFTCEALSEASEAAQKTVELAITTELRQANLLKATQNATLDALLFGTGIIQIGYYGRGLVPELGTAEESGEENLGKANSSDLPFGIRQDSIYVIDHRPKRFLIDPMATSIDNALWVAVEYDRPLEEVKKDPQYKNTANLTADVHRIDESPDPRDHENTEQVGGDTFPQQETEFVRLIQYWDIVKRQVKVLSANHPKFLAEPAWNVPTKRFPFYIIQSTVDTHRFWVQAAIMPWLNQVDELNKVMQDQLTHLNTFKRKYLYNKEMSAEDLEALETPRDGMLVAVDNQNGTTPLTNHVAPLLDAPTPIESFRFTAEVKEIWQQQSGISVFDLGGIQPGERPAAEINRISGGSNLRRQSLADRIGRPLQELAEDSRRIMEKFYTRERVVRMVGSDGDVIWQPYTSEDLSGDYHWNCRIEDMAPKTKASRIQEKAQAIQFLVPLAPLAGIDLRPLAQDFAKEFGMELEFLPQAQAAPMDPDFEWFQMKEKKRDLQPHLQEDLEYHLDRHTQQLLSAEAGDDQAAAQLLRNHIERTKGLLQAKLDAIQAQQAKQGGQGGQAAPTGQAGPGAPPGSQNNPGGGTPFGSLVDPSGQATSNNGGF